MPDRVRHGTHRRGPEAVRGIAQVREQLLQQAHPRGLDTRARRCRVPPAQATNRPGAPAPTAAVPARSPCRPSPFRAPGPGRSARRRWAAPLNSSAAPSTGIEGRRLPRPDITAPLPGPRVKSRRSQPRPDVQRALTRGKGGGPSPYSKPAETSPSARKRIRNRGGLPSGASALVAIQCQLTRAWPGTY